MLTLQTKKVSNMTKKGKHTVLFICLGNICRSPAAEGIMKSLVEKAGVQDEFEIDSAGIGSWHIGQLPDSRMRKCGAEHGYNFNSHARQFQKSDFARFETIVVMDNENYRAITSMASSESDTGALVLGGACGGILPWLESRGLAAADYLRREELCLANAVPSAEGAIQIAMEETARTLHGTAALVIGYGRIGMALAPRLRGLGMDVTVCARRCETRALAEMQGFAAVPTEQLPAAAKAALVIFNTVPALVLDETVLKGLPQETLVIDLASRPGGTDFEAAKRLRTRVVWALSLPPEMRR